MKKLRLLIGSVGLLLLLVLFQNCGAHSYLSSLQSLQSKTVDLRGGNGEGYDGKLDGTFYYFVPNNTCEGTASAKSVAEIKNGQVFRYENKTNQCSNQGTAAAASEINFSPFQNEFILVKDTLFKRYDDKPAGIPENLAEVLCRDDFTKPNFEIVTHFDRVKNEALGRVYFADRQIPDFSVSRVLSSTEIKYVSKNLTFKIDTSKIIATDKKFAGQIEMSTLNGVSSKPLTCVLGGSVDTSNWKLKVLSKVDASEFQLLQSGEIKFTNDIQTSTSSSQTHLFKVGNDGSIVNLTQSILNVGDKIGLIKGINTMNPSPFFKDEPLNESLSILYVWNPNGQWGNYVHDARTSLIKNITSVQPGIGNQTITGAVLTDDQHLFFDVDPFPGLRVYDFKTDTITKVMPEECSITPPPHRVLPRTNKVLIFWETKNGVMNVIQTYDAKTKLSTEKAIKIPGNCNFYGRDAIPINDETSIIIPAYCGMISSIVLQIDLSDGNVKMLGENKNISWISPDRKWLILNEFNNNTAINLQTGHSFPVPIDPSAAYLLTHDFTSMGMPNFSKNGFFEKIALVNNHILYGLGVNANSVSLFQTDLNTGASQAVCENAIGEKLFVGALADQKVFLFTYDSNLKVYRFYQVKSLTECIRINEFPSLYPAIPKLKSTNIGFALLLGPRQDFYSEVAGEEALFVPVDGRPPLKLSTNVKGNWDIEVSADKNRINLSGPDTDGIMKIFSFDLR